MIDGLPEEIITLILSFCDPTSLFNCFQVCWRLSLFSSNQSLWKQLLFNYLELNSNTFKLKELFPLTIKELDNNNSNGGSNDWKKLYYQYNVLSFQGSYNLIKLNGHLNNITTLYLGFQSIHDKYHNIHNHHINNQNNIEYYNSNNNNNESSMKIEIPNILLTGSRDGMVKVWSLISHMCIYTYLEHNGNPLNCVKLLNLPPFGDSPTLTLAVTACESPTLRIWQANNLYMGSTLFVADSTTLDAPITSIDVNHHLIIASDRNNTIYIFRLVMALDDRLSFILINKIPITYQAYPNTCILSLSILSTLPFIQQEQQQHQYNCNNNNNNQTPNNIQGYSKVKRLKQSTTTTHPTKIMNYQESTTSELISTIRITFRSKGMTGCDNIIIQDLDINTNIVGTLSNIINHNNSLGKIKQLKLYSCQEKGDVTSINYDDNTLLAASNNNTIRVFTGQAKSHLLYGHTASVTRVDSDDQKIVTFSSDGSIKIWSKKIPCRLLRTIPGVDSCSSRNEHPNHNVDVTKSPNQLCGSFLGTIMVSSYNSTIYVYDFTTTINLNSIISL